METVLKLGKIFEREKWGTHRPPPTPVLGFEPRSEAPQASMLSRLHHTGNR